MAAVIQADASKVAESNKFKDLGNAAFSAGKHEEAVKQFTAAIDADPNNHVLYSNRAAAYTELGKKDPSKLELAVADGEKCTQLVPSFGKGYSRTGAALFMLKRYNEAVKVFATGLAAEPSSRLLTEGLQKAQKYLAEQIDDGSDGKEMKISKYCLHLLQNQ
jgi:stress-induced-phosphoprotein 1